jgi:hypothetical protein
VFESTSAPLDFTYYITPQVTVKTSVFGDQRQNATVGIFSASMQVWAATLLQQAPTAEVGSDLVLGDATIKAGATFKLTVPTAVQQGNVLMNAMVASGSNPPQQTTAQVAQWPLSSAVAAGS